MVMSIFGENKAGQSDRVKRVVREGLINEVALGRLGEGGSEPQAVSLKALAGAWLDCILSP